MKWKKVITSEGYKVNKETVAGINAEEPLALVPSE